MDKQYSSDHEIMKGTNDPKQLIPIEEGKEKDSECRESRSRDFVKNLVEISSEVPQDKDLSNFGSKLFSSKPQSPKLAGLANNPAGKFGARKLSSTAAT